MTQATSMLRKVGLLLVLALPTVLAAQDPSPQTGAPPAPTHVATGVARKLPVKRVVLYKNGVGFFEHLGEVTGNERLSIDFTSAQLDDALKSLTVLDLNGGKVGAVGYNSEAPLARRLGALNLPLDGGGSAATLLGALRGARVEVSRGGATVAGRLLGVERRRQSDGASARDVDEISVISDAGDVRVFELGPATSVRLVERELHDRVGRYLGLVASDRDRDLRTMTIEAGGQGTRRLYVSYVSEVPVWKTTYRLVLPETAGADALLQGWAIVDNTVGEDWDDVRLSLVAGAPVSFVQQLSQPLYTSRPIVPLPSGALLVPQTHAGTLATGMGAVSGRVTDPSGGTPPGVTVRVLNEAGLTIASGTTDANGNYRFDAVPAGTATIVAELAGFQPVTAHVAVSPGGSASATLLLQPGALAEAVTVTGAEPSPAGRNAARAGGAPGGVVGGMIGSLPDAPPPPDYAGRMAMQSAAASGRDLGDLFEYSLDRPVTVKQNQSALVPILQAKIAAERVSLWSLAGDSGERPLNAVWITNTSPYTLDGGSVTLLDRNTYAGEGLTEAIKPAERRLLSYAVDLAVRVHSTAAEPARQVSRLRAARGVVTSETLSCAERTYTIRNEDAQPRTVVVEHPLRAGWTLAPGTPAPAETSSTAYRFSVPVAPKKTASLVVREAHAEESRFWVASLTDNQVTAFGRDVQVDAQTLDALRAILAKKAEIDGTDRTLAERDAETAAITADQQRVRENIKALKGSAEEKRLLERYVQQLSTQEDRLGAIATENAQLHARRQTLDLELTRMVEALSFDAAATGAAICGPK